MEILRKDNKEMCVASTSSENKEVCFENNEFVEDGVSKCEYDRYVYTMFLEKEVNEIEKDLLDDKYKQKALFVKRPNDPEKISELAIKRFS